MNVYTLIVVTYGATVAHTPGFHTLHMCEEAKSVAIYGMTIEDHKAREEKWKKEEDDAKGDWAAKHPPRDPRNKEERDAVSEVLKDSRLSTVWSATLGYPWHVTKDGKIQDDQPTSYASILERVSQSLAGPYDIKHAECVIEPEDEGK